MGLLDTFLLIIDIHEYFELENAKNSLLYLIDKLINF